MKKLLPIALLAVASGCSVREFIVDRTLRSQIQYIPDPEHFGGSELTRLTDHVYTFRWTWDRSLVVITDEGVVMTDPFNAEAAQALKAELDKVAPGKPVRAMIYSHYHLDHVPGGAVLKPQEVLAHKKCPQYWADLADDPRTKDILLPTRLIEGDQQLQFGGEEIDLIQLDRSHTDTLFAYYLPKEKLLYTADVGLVRTIFPIGGPDMYMPGMIREMERLSKLDFDTWVPSHFSYGKKSDFLEALEFVKTSRKLALDAWLQYGLPGDSDAFVRSYHAMYDPLKARYAGYHGFDEQILFHVSRNYSGAILGY
jgi:glyoxylase-like metal-dependent hydrolase (beta-lactamase superfamily II)